MASNTYTVTINLDQETIDHLNGSNGANQWSLLGFKAVQSANAGQPVVWFNKTGVFMSPLVLSWEEDDYAYISDSQIVPGGSITTSCGPLPIDPGQMATYDGDNLSVGAGNGDPQDITIYNSSHDGGLVCGLAKMQPSGLSSTPASVPICAFGIDGGNEVVMLPLVKILLMFTSQQVDTSSVAEKAYGPGMLVDLTGFAGDATKFTMSYDLNNDWDNGGAGWGTEVKPNAALSPILNPADNSAVSRHPHQQKARANRGATA